MHKYNSPDVTVQPTTSENCKALLLVDSAVVAHIPNAESDLGTENVVSGELETSTYDTQTLISCSVVHRYFEIVRNDRLIQCIIQRDDSIFRFSVSFTV